MFDVPLDMSLFLMHYVQNIDVFADAFQDISRCNIKHF